MFSFLKKKKKKNTCFISPKEEKWVKDNIHWIDKAVEKKYFNQFSVSTFNFELHQSSLESLTTYLVDILKKQFSLSQYIFKIRWVENPYKGEYAVHVGGELFERDIRRINNTYEFFLSEDLKQSVERLTYNLILCFTEAYYKKHDITEYIGEDKDSFLLLSAIYFGYGAVLSHGLSIAVVKNDPKWFERRIFEEHLPFEMLSYILAFLTNHYKSNDNEWESGLNKRVKECYKEFRSRIDVRDIRL